jgi:HlyD family secretion protein
VSEGSHGVFRKQALDRMSSPERLDQLIRIVSSKHWLMMAAMLAMMGGVVAWCILGRLPTTVSGQGIIIRPRKIIAMQSQAAGKLLSFNLHVGDQVRKGDLLGLVDQTEIRKQLQEDRLRLVEYETQDRRKTALQQEQILLQDREVEERKKYLLNQASSRDDSIRAAEALAPVLQTRLDMLTEVVKQGLEPRNSAELLQARKDLLENQSKISDLKVLRSEIEGQMQEFKTGEKELERTFFEVSMERRNQIMELRKNIALCEVQLERNTRIVAEHSGWVVEIAANLGQVMSPGTRLASVEVQEPSAGLVCVTYFPVRDGKRIQPGMKIQVTPDTVKRERFGGILGRVSSVSAFPVTREGASLLLGSPEVAARLLGDEPQIEVIAEPETDPATFSGYRWSSRKGPDLSITTGTTTTSRVTIEMRSPITYILPFLREISGIN